MQAHAEWGWIRKWQNDTECLGQRAVSYLHQTHKDRRWDTPQTDTSTTITTDTMQFACKRFSQLCHHPASWIHEPNEFGDHSRFGLSLGRPAVCRCMCSCRWAHFPLSFFFVIRVALSKFSSALHQCVWKRPRPGVPWWGGQTTAIIWSFSEATTLSSSGIHGPLHGRLLLILMSYSHPLSLCFLSVLKMHRSFLHLSD